uniref:PAS domain-containing protein n=1 Tax=Macrostomum lignano TaxID=282301 RepID=A0A1I8J9M3_9PLAT
MSLEADDEDSAAVASSTDDCGDGTATSALTVSKSEYPTDSSEIASVEAETAEKVPNNVQIRKDISNKEEPGDKASAGAAAATVSALNESVIEGFLIVVTQSADIYYVSPNICNYVDYSVEDLMKTSFCSIVHPDDIPLIRPYIQALKGQPGAGSALLASQLTLRLLSPKPGDSPIPVDVTIKSSLVCLLKPKTVVAVSTPSSLASSSQQQQQQQCGIVAATTAQAETPAASLHSPSVPNPMSVKSEPTDSVLTAVIRPSSAGAPQQQQQQPQSLPHNAPLSIGESSIKSEDLHQLHQSAPQSVSPVSSVRSSSGVAGLEHPFPGTVCGNHINRNSNNNNNTATKRGGGSGALNETVMDHITCRHSYSLTEQCVLSASCSANLSSQRGITSSFFVNKNWSDLVLATDRHIWLSHVDEIGSNREDPSSAVYRCQVAAGQYAFVKTRSKLWPDNKIFLSTHCIVRDCEAESDLKGTASASLLKRMYAATAAPSAAAAAASSASSAASTTGAPQASAASAATSTASLNSAVQSNYQPLPQDLEDFLGLSAQRQPQQQQQM